MAPVTPIINPPLTSNPVCEDHFASGLYVEWVDWEETKPRLLDARIPRRLGSLNIHLGGIWFFVSPRGKAVGRENGPYYEFVLECKDLGIEILIADIRGPSPSWANVRVTLNGGFFLKKGGARYGYELVSRILAELGGTVIRSEPSRVDICLDLPGVSIEAFADAFDAGQYITKAKAHPTYRSECDTLYFGRKGSLVRCCIYDKLCQVLEDSRMLELMRLRRWGEVIPSCATRIEFRVRRQAMKRCGIDQVEDLFAREGDMLRYLTTKWLRFTADSVDRTRNNQDQAKTLPLWTEVQQAFVEGVGGLSGEPIKPLPKAEVDLSQLGKQAVGVILRGAVDSGMPLPDLSAFNLFAIELMGPYAESKLPYEPPN